MSALAMPNEKPGECNGGTPGTALITRILFADRVRLQLHVWSDGERPRYCLLCCATEDGGKLAR